MNAVPLAEAKDRLSALVSDIATTHTHYTITRNGRPTVVMLPIDDLEALEETIFWLEREVERLRSGVQPEDGADISGEEMADLIRRRRTREGEPA
ncbi:MAG: type II toxin-antitoxin system prevent-host-death family antitoxin [Micromonosporaceae bacterium]|nr:type II toxin-antitoxin system prevent-host-death family antitoxin [Micromonosporaceae bacterium]